MLISATPAPYKAYEVLSPTFKNLLADKSCVLKNVKTAINTANTFALDNNCPTILLFFNVSLLTPSNCVFKAKT